MDRPESTPPSWPLASVTRSLSAREPSTSTSMPRAHHSLRHSHAAAAVTTLYNGISNRARGWKSKPGSDPLATDGMAPTAASANTKRWDGAARSCAPWDGLRRDPELWDRHGNCLVHLYGKGQSRKGPAFKVPFDALLAAKCHPLIERFVVLDDVQESPGGIMGQEYLDYWNYMNPHGKVELFIPTAPSMNAEQALQFHIAIRNFFAWIFNRSMVGEYLGVALIELLHCMDGFRCPGSDNMGDLIRYLDEEGYLDMPNQPAHAIAMLNFAEHYRLRDMYIDAFTHCAGMHDRLFAIPESRIMCPESKKLLKKSHDDMILRLSHAGVMLRNFLEDDLSEAHIGLTLGGRLHLERFRAFLLAFFTKKLGHYPPQPHDARSLVFEPEAYHIMRKDFQALYEYLVDLRFSMGETSPLLAQGGICTLQSVHGFDLRNKFPSLKHPLPLLPDILPPPQPSSSTARKRMSWFGVGGGSLGRTDSSKLRPDQRLVTHSALVKATNKHCVELLRNDLVVAYRRFEEDTIFSPAKTDRPDKGNGLTYIDARKIRWILVYAMYQVVRSCTQPPNECRDVEGVRYNVAVDASQLPPWRDPMRNEVPGLLRRRARGSSGGRLSKSGFYAQEQQHRMSMPAMYLPGSGPMPSEHSMSSSLQTTPSGYEMIRPDIDYFARKHPSEVVIHSGATLPRSKTPNGMPRLQGLNNSIRRSLSIFGNLSLSQNHQESQQNQQQDAKSPSQRARRQSYHEILVHGYGNGTNDVHIDQSKLPAKAQTAPGTPENRRAPASLPLGRGDDGDSPLTSDTYRSPSSSSSRGTADSTANTDLSTTPSPRTEYTANSSWAAPTRPGSASDDTKTKTGGGESPPSMPPLLPIRRIPTRRGSIAATATARPLSEPNLEKMVTAPPVPPPSMAVAVNSLRRGSVCSIATLATLNTDSRSFDCHNGDGDDDNHHGDHNDIDNDTPPALPRRNSRRNFRGLSELQPSPLRIRKEQALGQGLEQERRSRVVSLPALTIPGGKAMQMRQWSAVEKEVVGEKGEEDKDGDAEDKEQADEMVLSPGGQKMMQDVWEQFAHVGGLTDASTPTVAYSASTFPGAGGRGSGGGRGRSRVRNLG